MSNKFFKINTDDLDIFKKNNIQTMSYYVSSCVEYFTCGASAVIVYYGSSGKKKDETFGVSKKEGRASSRKHISGRAEHLHGGS